MIKPIQGVAMDCDFAGFLALRIDVHVHVSLPVAALSLQRY